MQQTPAGKPQGLNATRTEPHSEAAGSRLTTRAKGDNSLRSAGDCGDGSSRSHIRLMMIPETGTRIGSDPGSLLWGIRP